MPGGIMSATKVRGRLPHISEVRPFSDTDLPCFKEVRSVLEKHGMSGRFGLMLLHKHFDLGDDEVMIESCDVATRTLTSQPVKLSELEGVNTPATSWRLDTEDAVMRCIDVCMKDSKGNHVGGHSETR